MLKLAVILAVCLAFVAFANGNLPNDEVADICKLLPANTKILRPDSCIDWVECSPDGSVIDEGTCLDGWFFDRNKSKCNKSTLVECPHVVNTKSPCADVKTGTFLAHPHLCNGFIYCKDGVEQYSACPEGLNFEPASQSCVYPNVYTCPEEENNSTLNAICMSVGDNIRMADPNSCTSFRQCSKGVLKTTHCIAGTYFSIATGLCGELEDTDCKIPEAISKGPLSTICGTDDSPVVGFISDGKTCSGYYYCDDMKDGKADRNPTFGQCADGKFFDVNLFSCKDRTTVRCPYDRCEGMGNKFANQLGDCTKYTYCNDGVSTSEGSCPENFYFDEKAQSCTKKFIAYLACVE